MLGLVLSDPVEDRHGLVGESPAKDSKMVKGLEHLKWGEVEGAEAVQPGEEVAQG